MRRVGLFVLGVWLMCAGLFVAPTAVSAAEAAPSVLITEVQTGTKLGATQEFIELYNAGDAPVDLSGWQVWYLTAKAVNPDKPAARGVIKLANARLPAGGYYVLSGSKTYVADTANQFYAATLAAAGGHVRLLAPDSAGNCRLDVYDQVGWGTALHPEGQAVGAPAKDASIQRAIDSAGMYIDADNNIHDFVASTTTTPGVANAQTLSASNAAPASILPVITDPYCKPNAAGTPGMGSDTPAASANVGLSVPFITELLPNPASPQTDSHDEFIELYNANDTAFDLGGYKLQVGVGATHNYTFPAGSSVAPRTFKAFFAAETGLGLSNSGGQVKLLDSNGTAVMQSEPYDTAGSGQAWVLANGAWYWTSSPTPNTNNLVTTPIVTASTKKPKASPAVKAPKTAAASTKAAAGKVKAATLTKAKKSKASDAAKATVATTTAEAGTPIHPAILALTAVFALLYGAYEYRNDLANKLHQLRTNRAARTALRQSTKGR
ncbi:MAG TPA: lamin tail domain-containing protein [Nevskiaceae bacterium]|nr:lamin tail domain-containing protein [Nevskiaceae bacterium]